MTAVYPDTHPVFPERCTLTVLAPVVSQPATVWNALIISFTPFGIVWRADIAHPGMRTFTPWAQVYAISWEEPTS